MKTMYVIMYVCINEHVYALQGGLFLLGHFGGGIEDLSIKTMYVCMYVYNEHVYALQGGLFLLGHFGGGIEGLSIGSSKTLPFPAIGRIDLFLARFNSQGDVDWVKVGVHVCM
jgi:hypothetical protein